MSTRKQRGDYDGKIAGLYDLEDTIGRGHFAVVKLARHVFTGEKVAVKVIDKTKLDEISRQHLFQEVRCMKLVQHPHVVRLYEVIDTQTKLYLILELGDGGDMYDYIMKHKAGLQESTARLYFRQIVEAISYCHKLHVVHRDLKPENVVFFEKLGIVKLTDFGFSNMFNPGKQLETSCGSLAYSAPEILLGDSYDAPAVDIWSLGVILFMLVCGVPPFQEANDSETLTMIMDCKYKVPSTVSPHCQHLISRMLVREPSKRANLGEILSNPWLAYGLECGIDFMPSSVPLLSREHISDDDHDYVIQKMVEGKIASKDEILESLDKDGYDHIAATYYLLIERRLKKHEQIQHQHAAAMTHLRKKSDVGHSKPHLEPLSLSPRVITAGNKEKKDDKTKTGFVQSLLSPPGTHPIKSGVGIKKAQSSDKQLRFQKSVFIREETSDNSTSSHEEYMEVDDVRPVKSLENLLDIGDDMSKSTPSSTHKLSSPSHEQHKRTLKSVCSSPQLLNQIYEENESDDDDDIVPSKYQSNAMFAKHSGVASPEILRKYEQRTKRRSTGQRGTSCSSSDASDTDETEGRSRKDKLKHKFAHRRDSSDHSSDTDGPSGHTGSGSNYGSSSGTHFNGGSSNNGNGGGGGNGGSSQDKNNKKENNGSSKNSKGHRQNTLNHHQMDINMKVLSNRLSQISANNNNSQVNGNNNNNIVNQKSFNSLSVQYIGPTDNESMIGLQVGDFSELVGSEVEQNQFCSEDCHQIGKSTSNKVLTDVNSNGLMSLYCKPDISQCIIVPNVESKCCSVV